MTYFVAHYSEIALKGKNRARYTRALIRNILSKTGKDAKVSLQESRLIVECSEQKEEKVSYVLSRTFGIAWFARVMLSGREIEEIKKNSISLISDKETFRVVARRSDKSYPLNSMQIERIVGEAISKEKRVRVDLRKPELEIHIDVLKDKALIYTEKKRGLNGLPVGTSGKVIHLFSGGIDSPVASFLLMKRGCIPVYLHFHPFARNEHVVETKITSLLKVLTDYSPRTYAVLAPFTEYQLATIEHKHEVEPVLFRYFMRVFAERLASILGAGAISTGDSLAQAASQTVWNIRAADYLSSYPVLRPLISLDKQEIIEIAKNIGTYELSIKKYKDCCSIIAPRPRTKVSPELVRNCFQELDLDSVVNKTMQQSEALVLEEGKFEKKSLEELSAILQGLEPFGQARIS